MPLEQGFETLGGFGGLAVERGGFGTGQFQPQVARVLVQERVEGGSGVARAAGELYLGQPGLGPGGPLDRARFVQAGDAGVFEAGKDAFGSAPDAERSEELVRVERRWAENLGQPPRRDAPVHLFAANDMRVATARPA